MCEKLELVNEYYFALVMDRAFMVWLQIEHELHVHIYMKIYIHACI